MNDPRAVSGDLGPIGNSTTEGQLGSLAIQTASDSVCQPSNLVELSCVEQQIPDVIGLHVSKRFAEVMYEGIVEGYDSISEMFKVVYFNGLSEAMRWEDLMKYLVHRDQPLPLSSNELANKDHDTGNSLALVALAPKTRKPGRTRKQSRPVKREVAKNACPPKQAGRRGSQPSASDACPPKQAGRRGPQRSASDASPPKKAGRRGPQPSASDACPPKQYGRRGPQPSASDASPPKQVGRRGPQPSASDACPPKRRRGSQPSASDACAQKRRRGSQLSASDACAPRQVGRRGPQPSASDACPPKQYGRRGPQLSASDACPPKQVGRRGPQHSASDDEGSETGLQRSIIKYETSEVTSLRRSTRKRKELGYTYCEDSTDEDELVDDDEADYALPAPVQVPWVDWADEPPPKGPMKGICTSKGYKKPTKKQWVSLRISADAKPKDGQKKPATGDRKD